MFSISHTLGDLLENFDMENSAFLEDEPRKMAKPNPESLIHCMEGMGIENAIFVGDSSEDLLLAHIVQSREHVDLEEQLRFVG